MIPIKIFTSTHIEVFLVLAIILLAALGGACIMHGVHLYRTTNQIEYLARFLSIIDALAGQLSPNQHDPADDHVGFGIAVRGHDDTGKPNSRIVGNVERFHYYCDLNLGILCVWHGDGDIVKSPTVLEIFLWGICDDATLNEAIESIMELAPSDQASPSKG